MTTADDILRRTLGLSRAHDEPAVLRLLVDLGRQVIDAEEGSLLVLERSRRRLVFAMTCGSRASEETLLGQSVPLGKGITGLAAATGEVQIGSTTYRGVRQSRRPGASARDPTAVLAAPMIVDGEVVGVLTAASFRRGRLFTSDDAALYAKIASVAGVVVDQRRHLDALERAGRRRAPARARTGAERERARLAGSVARLAAGGRGRLARVARVLSALEDLCGRGRS